RSCSASHTLTRRGASSPGSCWSEEISMRGVNMRRRTAFLALAALLSGGAHAAADDTIVVASTTSTQDSGLFSWLLPIVKQQTGITVKVLAQGTGQAL